MGGWVTVISFPPDLTEGKDMDRKNSIIVYTSKYCPFCSKVKYFLKSLWVDFEEVSIDEKPEVEQNLVETNGSILLPQISINGKIIVGFDEKAITKELKKIVNT